MQIVTDGKLFAVRKREWHGFFYFWIYLDLIEARTNLGNCWIYNTSPLHMRCWGTREICEEMMGKLKPRKVKLVDNRSR